MRRGERSWGVPLALLLCSAWAGSLVAQQDSQADAKGPDDTIVHAMRDELARSMAKLRLGELDRPYFIAYDVREGRSMDVSATCGSLLASSDGNPVRTFSAQVRVGGYALDNSNFLSMPSFSLGTIEPQFGFNELPVDNDYREIRRQMWLATDGAYKQALEQLAQKKAALQNSTRADNLPDFSRESPTRTTDIEPPIEMKRSDAEALVRPLSKSLGALPGLQTSAVSLSVGIGRTLYLNSEGTFYEKARSLIALSAVASTQAMDGMRLADSVSFYARSLAGLPPRDQVASRMVDMARRLAALRDARLLDRYSGPVLFEGRAAAEIFSEEFAPALIGKRKAVSGTSEMDAAMERFGQLQAPSFAGNIGSRVLPDFLSVVDDPTLAAYDQQPLLGGYKVDDEGVPAHETLLVESGILRTFLTDRTPVDGVGRSTGNRRGEGAIPSNLLVKASAGLGEAELRSRLLELVRQRGLEYGIVVSELGSRSGTSMGEQALAMISAMTGQAEEGRGVLVAYKLYRDGHEELIRGAHLSRISPESFKDIVAASKTATVFHGAQMPHFDFSSSFFTALGAELGGSPSLPMISYVVPSLLLEDLSLTKPSGVTPRPPFSDPPPCGQ